MADITKDLSSELCVCGRFAWKVHCPFCGSSQTYALKQRDFVTRSPGGVVELTVHQCRKCGNKFNDDEWQLRCRAPNVILSKVGRRAAAPSENVVMNPKVPEYTMNAAERALEELKKKKGWT